MPVQMYSTIKTIGRYRLRIPLSGGKAGRGKAKTSNVQVLNTSTMIIATKFPFKLCDLESKRKAIAEATAFAESIMNIVK